MVKAEGGEVQPDGIEWPADDEEGRGAGGPAQPGERGWIEPLAAGIQNDQPGREKTDLERREDLVQIGEAPRHMALLFELRAEEGARQPLHCDEGDLSHGAHRIARGQLLYGKRGVADDLAVVAGDLAGGSVAQGATAGGTEGAAGGDGHDHGPGAAHGNPVSLDG